MSRISEEFNNNNNNGPRAFLRLRCESAGNGKEGSENSVYMKFCKL
jgi:hypothetical protein